MKDTELKKRLIENAIDFLMRAIDEFQSHPKYSIINFYSAVELFLKARLLHEHWSLVVQNNPDRQKFEAGDFVSVPFDTACERLHKIVQSPISDGARRNFEAVKRHRNRMVHFFHEADNGSKAMIASIAKEQLRSWYELNKLLSVQWSQVFSSYRDKFTDIERRLKGHRDYLRAKYDDVRPQILEDQAKGIHFQKCVSCEFDAARVSEIIGKLLEEECLVCGLNEKWFNFQCPECENQSPLQEGGEFECPECHHRLDQNGIADAINEFVATKHNYFEAKVPANCSECESYHSIVEYQDNYLCVVCLTRTTELEVCGWCSEYNNGDMEDSYLKGCSICEGSAGWNADKDD